MVNFCVSFKRLKTFPPSSSLTLCLTSETAPASAQPEQDLHGFYIPE